MLCYYVKTTKIIESSRKRIQMITIVKKNVNKRHNAKNKKKKQLIIRTCSLLCIRDENVTTQPTRHK